MFDAVIFDLDGLLIDSEPLWVRAELEVFSAAGVVLTEMDCLRTKGLRIDDLVAFWHAERGLAVKVTDVEERLVRRVVELIESEGKRLPGVETAIATARSMAPKLALASSSPAP